jgi:menaquinone-dependent protoporphyrinogen oxidase
MAKILIVYSTTDGHTLRICQHLRQFIEQQKHLVTLVSIGDAPETALDGVDKIVVGGSIRYGNYQAQVYEWARRNRVVLVNKPSAFFSVNLTARKPDKNRAETNPYIKKFLKKSAWQPCELAVFAGRIDYPNCSFLDRHIIRCIMWMTNGPTNPNTVIEFTDWECVNAFAQRICLM